MISFLMVILFDFNWCLYIFLSGYFDSRPRIRSGLLYNHDRNISSKKFNVFCQVLFHIKWNILLVFKSY